MNISFFMSDKSGQGLLVDNEVVLGIQRHQFWKLSQHERDFLLWYINEVRTEGLECLHIACTRESFDMSQEEICFQFMSMIRSENIPDPEMF